MLTTTTLHLRSPEKFRDAMTAKGATTRSLAAAAGCSPARIGQLMVDRDRATRDGTSAALSAGIATAIAAALEVEVRDLFEFPDGEALVRLGLIRAV